MFAQISDAIYLYTKFMACFTHDVIPEVNAVVKYFEWMDGLLNFNISAHE